MADLMPTLFTYLSYRDAASGLAWLRAVGFETVTEVPGDDVDAVYTRALAAGTTVLLEPESTEWGTRRSRVLDPEGHEWTFRTYEPGGAW